MRYLFSILFLFSLSNNVTAQDFDNGVQLHADQCVRCHDDSVYTRANRRVKSLPQLGKQVRFCKDNIGVQWFDDEVNDVILYLNKKYYQF